jgi:hypothetical protein
VIQSRQSSDGRVALYSWGDAYDKGYSAGRVDALDSGVSGLFEEIGRYRLALAAIGRKGEPLSGFAARAIARKALDRSGSQGTT